MTISKDTTTKFLLASISAALWIIVIRLFAPAQPAIAAPVQGAVGSGGSIAVSTDKSGPVSRSTVFAIHNGKVTVISNRGSQYEVEKIIVLK